VSFPDLRGRAPDVSVIFPELLIGEYPRLADVAWLREKHAVSAVLSLQHDSDLWQKGLNVTRLEEAYERAAIAFRRIPVEDYDESGLEAALAVGIRTLEELLHAGHTVFVHCNAGYNRAPTLVIAYLCASRGMSLDSAAKHVKACRVCLPYMTVLRRRYV
jgi:atypical dual specificity phosphatase